MSKFGYTGMIIKDHHKVIWKTEGLTDALSIISLGLPEGHSAVTNACGSSERPTAANDWFARKMKGRTVFVVHDQDTPGQDGAIGDAKTCGWAPAFARHCDDVYNVRLPYEMQEKHGKDVRDWINEQREAGIDKQTVYKMLLEMAYASERVKPFEGKLRGEKSSANNGSNEDSLPGGEDAAGDETDDDDEDEEGEALDVLDRKPSDPYRLAILNLENYEEEIGGKVRYWNQDWLKYKDGVHRPIGRSELQAKVTKFANDELYRHFLDEMDEYEKKGDDEKRPPEVIPVSASLSASILKAMESECVVPGTTEMNTWLDGREDRNYISMKNGILCMDEAVEKARKGMSGEDFDEQDTSHLLDHSSEWFSTIQLPYEFDTNAGCPTWQSFLMDVFSGDLESIEALQQWFGYMLLPDHDLNKAMMIIGPTRSGKGTIMNTLIELVGRQSVAAMTFEDIMDKNAMHELVGKTVGVFPDARLTDRDGGAKVAQKILSISGGDPVTVKRKYKDSLTSHKLPTRFTLFSNQLPRLVDTSAAIMGRFVFLLMKKSYLNNEDYTLGDRIKAELPGILNWSIVGRVRLKKQGRIIEPQAGGSLRTEMERNIAPVSLFLRDECVKDGETFVHHLFEEYIEWSKSNNMISKLNVQSFARKVHEVRPELGKKRGTTMGERKWKFVGISPRQNDGNSCSGGGVVENRF